ncbi:hypothetical protein QR680_015593 [Steinernema hermaphroditum]|uniref:G-protein coupled receptors family 1 profile domain-containing protein n=1 Tax=Steinernema hermaphroditum TaxID=289476 RepID=A0AA39LKW3_9BILA|nr:hypothetical protein QR680_015593 [Steinernema hermaphroditum]
MDIVQEYRNRFELYRWIIIANTIVALLTNALALYLVIYRSPKHIKTYKYVLLNILLCALVTDVIFEVVVLPSPLLAVLAVYPRGLVSALGTEASFVCQVLAIASVSEFLAALLIAFFYRYLALQDGISFRGKRIERRHYWFAIVLLMLLSVTEMSGENNIVQEHEKTFRPYRYVIIANIVVAVPLNVLAGYLIIFRSPKQMKTYSRVLLNILFWVFISDVFLEMIVMPAPVMDILGAYATGLARWIGPEGGFACEVTEYEGHVMQGLRLVRNRYQYAVSSDRLLRSPHPNAKFQISHRAHFRSWFFAAQQNVSVHC